MLHPHLEFPRGSRPLRSRVVGRAFPSPRQPETSASPLRGIVRSEPGGRQPWPSIICSRIWVSPSRKTALFADSAVTAMACGRSTPARSMEESTRQMRSRTAAWTRRPRTGSFSTNPSRMARPWGDRRIGQAATTAMTMTPTITNHQFEKNEVALKQHPGRQRELCMKRLKNTTKRGNTNVARTTITTTAMNATTSDRSCADVDRRTSFNVTLYVVGN